MPPFGTIWMELLRGRVVPFLGAGASRGSGAGPPSGARLSEMLAVLGNFPSTDPRDRCELAKVASFYEESNDRPGLVEVLRNIFARDYEPGAIHRFLARRRPAPLIITTNYDDLIERAFREAKRPFHLVVHPTDRDELMASVLWWAPGETEPRVEVPSKLPLQVGKTPIIYKIHGSIDPQKEWDSFVISEDDYVDFLARMTRGVAVPSLFAMHLKQAHFLFLGYGLEDWNLRLLLRILPTADPADKNALSGGARPLARRSPRRAWAINVNPSSLEQQLWDKRGVNIYDCSVDDFTRQMEAWIREPAKRQVLVAALK